MRRIVLLLASLGVALSGCPNEVEPIVLVRPSCNTCHQPLNGEGEAHGIEEAHPWYPLDCVDCHGGTDFDCNGTVTKGEDGALICDGELRFEQHRAHVSPGAGPEYIKNLPSRHLDNLNPDYVRFINPGDLRVAQVSCGGGNPRAGDQGAGGCHQKAVDNVQTNTMAHTTGEVTVARYRAGKQPDPYGRFGPRPVTDPNYDPTIKCSVESLSVYDPEPIVLSPEDHPDGPTVGNLQDQYMVKSCFRCHLSDFGENAFPGDFRSSGCTACHMPYADDGFSRSSDPWVAKEEAPHPIRHELTLAPPIETCTHCHYRGGRIGNSYQGFRESAGGAEFENQENVEHLGVAIHNHPPTYYVVDEDTTNSWDETPPDVHFEAGMHCVDCHTTTDVHGDGHIYADTQCAVTSECTDCHGTVRERAIVDPLRNNIFEEDGKFFLNTKVTNRKLEVKQVVDVVTPGNPNFNPLALDSMGVNAGGFSHTDQLECYTCHAAWLPTCYGCHVEVDLTREAPYHTTGQIEAGRSSGSRAWVQLNDLVLLWNSDGKLAPSMPAERFFMTTLAVDEEASEAAQATVAKKIMDLEPRRFTFPDGRTIAGFGQRAFNPHTTRKSSQFMACDRCHQVEDTDNKVLLDITHGFGSNRYPYVGACMPKDHPECDPDTGKMVYMLDRVITDDGEPLVVIGHPDPIESRVLTMDEIQAMRDVIVPKEKAIYTTDMIEGAANDHTWPKNKFYK